MDFRSGLAAGGVAGRLVRDLRDRFKGNPKELDPGWRDPQDPAKKDQMASPDQQNRYASGAETKASAESTTGSIFSVWVSLLVSLVVSLMVSLVVL